MMALILRRIQLSGRNAAVLLSLALTTIMLSLSAGCAPDADPFKVGDRRINEEGTPTPVPAGVVVPAAGSEDSARAPDLRPAKATIRLVEWDDKNGQVVNYIVGYLAVYGYVYNVNLIQTTADEYQNVLAKGEADAALILDRTKSGDWYGANTRSGAFADLGSVYKGRPEQRTVAVARLKQDFPEIADLMARAVPGDETLDELAASITPGRTGVKPSVAALVFLKNHEEIWTTWIPPEAVAGVKDALSRNKTGLNRNCTRVWGSQDVVCKPT